MLLSYHQRYPEHSPTSNERTAPVGIQLLLMNKFSVQNECLSYRIVMPFRLVHTSPLWTMNTFRSQKWFLKKLTLLSEHRKYIVITQSKEVSPLGSKKVINTSHMILYLVASSPHSICIWSYKQYVVTKLIEFYSSYGGLRIAWHKLKQIIISWKFTWLIPNRFLMRCRRGM